MDSNLELQRLSSLIMSKEWGIYESLMGKHEEYLQEQVNTFIRAKRWEEAYAALAKMDDVEHILGLLRKRIDDLQKRSE